MDNKDELLIKVMVIVIFISVISFYAGKSLAADDIQEFVDGKRLKYDDPTLNLNTPPTYKFIHNREFRSYGDNNGAVNKFTYSGGVEYNLSKTKDVSAILTSSSTGGPLDSSQLSLMTFIRINF